MSIKTILLTNDDGIDSDGINALKQGLAEDYQLFVVGPSHEQSGTSHSISLGKQLHVEEYTRDGIPHFVINGTPVDCVKFALSEIKEYTPDLVISGINHGANTGVSVFYSGTISAAREAAINQVPGVALSLCSNTCRDFEAAVNLAKQMVASSETWLTSPRTLLNINLPPIPANEIKGIKLTKQASSHFMEEFIIEEGPQHEKSYRLAGEIKLLDQDGTSDEEAVCDNYISITPLRMDITDYEVMESLEGWVKEELKS